MKLLSLRATTLLSLLVFCSALAAQTLSIGSLEDVQHAWAKIKYELPADQQAEAFEGLLAGTQPWAEASSSAEARIWLGIVESSLAGAKGGIGALKYAKAAKANLEQALAENPQALQGSALTSLGVLYHKVPGWPVSFGSDKQAEKLLTQALAINPDGIDPNFFYAEYLFDKGRYQDAQKHLQAALNAPARPDRPVADKGRREEVTQLMASVEKKLRKTKG